MQVVKIDTIKKAVYELCYNANTKLSGRVYSKILNAYQSEQDENLKLIFASIIENAKIANQTKRPLCQDTGQVLVFLSVGQDVHITGADLNDSVNQAVKDCYIENYFRKSVVYDAFLSRKNTNTNTPIIIYTEIVPGEEVKIDVLIKGAGSENKSKAQMMLPTSSREEIKEYIAKSVIESGTSSCPPLFIGVGIGGTFDKSALLAKKALLLEKPLNDELELFSQEIKDYINLNSPKEFNNNYVLDLNILTSPTHIACLPVSVCINCHSSREAGCKILGDKIEYLSDEYDFLDSDESLFSGIKEVNVSDSEKIRNLKEGEQVLLTGEIFVARDEAHARIIDLIKNNEKLPFEIKDKIILYAGPCPSKPGEIIGPIGPTTSSRMDKFAPFLYDRGLLATIGKGERNQEVAEAIKKNNAVYFVAIGGVASLLSSRIKKSEIIAFEELGAEAIYKIQADKLPVMVNISSN